MRSRYSSVRLTVRAASGYQLGRSATALTSIITHKQ